MKNEQDREQLQRYFGQGNNSDPLKNSNRSKRSEDLSFDQTQWFVSEDGQDEDDFEQEEPQPQEDFLPNGGKKKTRSAPPTNSIRRWTKGIIPPTTLQVWCRTTNRCALESMKDISSRTPMNFIPI